MGLTYIAKLRGFPQLSVCPKRDEDELKILRRGFGLFTRGINYTEATVVIVSV